MKENLEKYNLPRENFFKYLPLRSLIYSQTKTTIEPKLSTIELFMLNYLHGRGQLSKVYDILLSGSKDKVDICLEEWEMACFQAQTQTISSRCKLLQYKWLFRTYITPVKLHNFNPDIPDTCIRCTEEIGTLYHCI